FMPHKTENPLQPVKYVSCDLIEHGLDFFTDSINFCCRIPPTEKGYKKIIENYNGELINWEIFFSIKRRYRTQMKNGNIIPECKNCIYLQEKEWDNEDYISFINFNNWTICNEHCVYCWLNDKDRPHQKQYNVYPAIKDMADKGYLRKGGHITIAGGEPCSAPEFDDLLKLFIEHDLSSIRVLTNATKYSEAVERGIKEGRVNIVVSVDSGTRETFIKVKRFDFYDRVWQNIKTYAAVQPACDRVKTKFILIPGLNDTKEEITAWITNSINAGVKHLAFDVEMMWYNQNKDNIPSDIYETVKFTLDKIKENGLDVELIDRGYILSQNLHS
ncbi:MAG: radical SAM protein, partial [Candidatus Gastranaerophilales bacterium]|nr:radical SAM protein [Candidatus Gastranaerophilales bacterium]